MTLPPINTPASTVGILTLGCPKNEVDSDKMAAVLVEAGYTVLDDWVDADVVVVNTCSFISDATVTSVEWTVEVAEAIAGTDRKLVLAGCMASRYGEPLLGEFPEVHALAPVDDEHRIAEIVGGLLGVSSKPSDTLTLAGSTEVTDLDDVERRFQTGPSAYIKIADGCSRECTFCSIPSFRGPYRSRPIDSIVREAEALSAAGAKEIVLIAQDTSSFGSDFGADGPSLADVITAVAAIDSVRWVRTMYLQPSGVSDSLLATMASTPKFVPYIEMPLQHASKNVLRSMARPGGAEQYLALLGRIRSTIPNVVLRTTVMVGFPGETDDDFEQLVSFLDEAQFDYVGVFAYSAEEGTKAGAASDQIDPDIASERMQRVIDLADPISWSKALSQVGREMEVLVETYDEEEGAWVGRFGGQAPDIDGSVLIVDPDRSEGIAVGDLVSATIVDSVLYDLVAEVTR